MLHLAALPYCGCRGSCGRPLTTPVPRSRGPRLVQSLPGRGTGSSANAERRPDGSAHGAARCGSPCTASMSGPASSVEVAA